MKYRVSGLDKYVRRLEAVCNPFTVQGYIEHAITEGAEIVEYETYKELRSMQVDDRQKVPEGEMRNGLRSIQKAALINSFGLSKIQTRNDSTNRKTGVDRGVNKFKQPHVTVARMLENGTSKMRKNPVFSRASRKARKQCINAMAESLRKAYISLMR